jgi:hypothetical protein
MSQAGKLITIALIGGGAIAGYSYYLRMKRTEAQLEIIPDAKIHEVSWNGLTIRLDLLMKNPAKGSFKVKFPFVKLTYKGATIGSSQVADKNITIPAYGQVKIEKILVNIPIMSIFTVSSSILKAIQNNEQVKITATLSTTIDLGLVKLPFEESHEVILKK